MSKNDKAFNFSPGPLGKFLDRFAKKNGLKNRQEATRQIVRERMQADQAKEQAQG
jgi:hypothetical protein